MPLKRSWMFVPGNHERRLEKARDLKTDILIYDLEDAVPLQQKEKARKMTAIALRQNRHLVQYVRVNDPATPYYMDDVSEVVGEGLAGIVLPKAASRDQIRAVDQLLSQIEQQHGLSAGVTEIVPLIESAVGLHYAFEIASASSRVRQLAFGSVDFTLDIGAQLTKEGKELLFARSHLVVISRAAGIEPPIDAVYLDIKDEEGLKQDARLARQLGFQGKLVIHPDQIKVVDQVFSPTPEEIADAKTIVAAFDDALAAGLAAIQVNGKLVDYPVAERAKRIMEQAKALTLTP